MNLERVDHIRSLRADSLLLYCPVYNERSLLPIFLAHHRRLKVDGFVFIDNGSTDGSLEYLLEQTDCIVYTTQDSYAEANYAADWISLLSRRHSAENWALYLDCDELLIYEDCESIGLRDFIDQCSRQGFDAFYAIMLDAYSNRTNNLVTVDDCKDFSQSHIFVDRDYVIRKPPHKPWRPAKKGIEILGGPRGRLYGDLDREIKRGWWRYFIAGQVDRFIQFLPMWCIPPLARCWPRPKIAQHKTPLNYIHGGFTFHNSHNSSNCRPAPYLMGILHLKFSTALQQKLDPVFAYKNHYRKGLERFRLSHALRKNAGRSLQQPGKSIRYVNSKSLVSASLIGDWASHVWLGDANFARTTQNSDSAESRGLV